MRGVRLPIPCVWVKFPINLNPTRVSNWIRIVEVYVWFPKTKENGK